MKIILILVVFLLSFPSEAATTDVENGVSWELAQTRRCLVSNVAYRLAFTLPESKDDPVMGKIVISFEWAGGTDDLFLDFQGQLDDNIVINGKLVKAIYRDEHILLPAKRLKKSCRNEVAVCFTSNDNALNRNEEYLYTLFVPDHARSVFPCFDQPDIKARFQLTLDLPESWKAISNAPLVSDSVLSQGRRFLCFAPSDLLPTYLFSFTAGLFTSLTTCCDGYQMTALFRETDSAKVSQMDEVFAEAALCIRWMEHYTGIRQPFQQYGFVVLPGYQFGGMEHPGCIQFRDRTIFLGNQPTPDEEMNRLHLIAHETAHLWFGDLVTMRWFDDVWTKEVFANFMADKIAHEQYPDINHELNFLRTHYPLSLSTDRTEGTHPIQQPLDNLNKAGLLYGNIIYHKAPIMMRKLEERLGETTFRNCLQHYLHTFSFGNATWDDLIGLLDTGDPKANIKAFDAEWVKNKGVATLDIIMTTDSQLPNPDGMGYARYRLPDSTAADIYMARRLELASEQARLAHAMTLYDNYLMHTIDGNQAYCYFLTLVSECRNQQSLPLLCSQLNDIITHLPRSLRSEPEQAMWQLAQKHPVASCRKQLLRLLSTTAITPMVADSLYTLWEQQNEPSLDRRDYTQMAYHLALLFPNRWKSIIDKQRRRLITHDEQCEFDFVSRGCHPSDSVQQALFSQLLQKEHRSIEPYALSLLSLLNDELREPMNNRYVMPSLEVLEEVQQTGDIFFPLDWCNALLRGHRSQEASHAVVSFLNAHPNYPSALRNKLLQAAFRLTNTWEASEYGWKSSTSHPPL